MRHVAIIIASLLTLLAAGPASAQTMFERLVMPGPLIKGHADLEKTCSNCHEDFAKKGQTPRCLACHKQIASDRSRKSGFHGTEPEASTGECRACHTDHKGRKAVIVQFDKETFSHAFTRFALTGAHKSARCDGCHKPAQKYRAAPSQCVECHRQSDTHKGSLGNNCASCHSDTAWTKTKRFDHAATRFSLTGAHGKVACAGCHAGERYKNTPRSCVACHGIQDPHGRRNGTKCDTCHTAMKWTDIKFDHAKATKFPLKGAHARQKCATCHTGDLYKDKLSTTCVSCHRKNDPHKGQLGTRCSQCHDERGWRKTVRFDHDLTRFPLLGLHVAVPCEECHRTPRFKDAQAACATCHADTHHKGRFGEKCANCHNPNGWTRWLFDHDKQTAFRLTGSHQRLQCHACHRATAAQKPKLSTSCFSCHSTDDAHDGALGRKCETCHTTRTFRDARKQR